MSDVSTPELDWHDAPEVPLDELEVDDRPLQVRGDAFEEEQRRAGGVEPRREQRLGDRVGGEVGRDEAELRGRQAQSGDPFALVLLGRRVVDLEPADPGLGVAEGAAVVARTADHHLRDAAVERGHYDPVEEGGPPPEVLVHAAALRREAVRNVPGEGFIGVRVAVRCGGPLVVQAARGDAPRGVRGGSFLHSGCLLVCPAWSARPGPRGDLPCRRLPREADSSAVAGRRGDGR